MKMPLFKLFKTRDYNYAYDPVVNEFVWVSDFLFHFLETLQKDYSVGDTVDEEKIKDKFSLNLLKEIQENTRHLCFYDKPIMTPFNQEKMKYMYSNGLTYIILEMTRNCNMRCKYCMLNSCYGTHTSYSEEKMSFDTIKQSIDFLISRSLLSPIINIGFFGGEPLLCFEEIKYAIEYVEKTVVDKTKIYTITTNALLLNDEMLRFFSLYNVKLNISIDGPQYIHDYNRRTLTGHKTHKIVENNIVKIIEKFPKLFANLSFNSVSISPLVVKEITDYFKKLNVSEYIIFGLNSSQNNYPVDEFEKDIQKFNNYKEPLSYHDFTSHVYDWFEANDLLKIKALFSDYPFYKNVFLKEIRSVLEQPSYSENMIRFWPSGNCPPGVARTYIGIDGNLFLCERTNTSDRDMILGNVEAGFDWDKISMIQERYSAHVNRQCKTCWALRHCQCCWNNISDGFHCEKIRENLSKTIQTALMLFELDEDVIEKLQSV